MAEAHSHSFALGTPRFRDARLSEIAAREGALAAWQRGLAMSTSAMALAAKVEGDFSVAVREPSGRCFLAVDRFAIRTLCYRVVGDRIEVAPRADELVGEGDIDPQAIYDYLYFHVIPSPRTIFAGVQRLPAGYCAVFENGRLTVERYWVPQFVEDKAPRFEPLAERFRDVVEKAVAAQLEGGKPACFLSGGTDSSTVAGMLGRASGRRAATYSIGFEAEGYDEMAFARIAARHFDTEHHEYYVTPDDLVRSIPAVAAHYDQPFGNSSALPSYYCASMARDDGVTKLLAGDGGDELFGGNSRYAKQRVFGWYAKVPAGMRGGFMEPLLERSPLGRLPLLRKGASYVEQAKVPMPERQQMYNLLLRLGVRDVFTEAFLHRIDANEPARSQREVWEASRADSELNCTLAYDWRYTLAETDLPKVCGTTELAGVAVGFPFLDQAVVDFSLALPADYKLKGMKLRWFFKEALRGFLPDEIITKKKQGFGLPFGVWALRHEPLKRLAADTLASLATRGVVRPDFIAGLMSTRLPEHPGYYGEMVWILMMLEQWMQRHAPGFRLAA